MGIEERRRRGEKLLEEMLGSHQAQKTRDSWHRISPDFESYVVEFLSGKIWSRRGLDLWTKSPITIATLAGMGRNLGLELNIRIALRNGANRPGRLRRPCSTLLPTPDSRPPGRLWRWQIVCWGGAPESEL